MKQNQLDGQVMMKVWVDEEKWAQTTFRIYVLSQEFALSEDPEVVEKAVEGELALNKTFLSKDSSSLVDVVDVVFDVDSEVAAAEDWENLFTWKDGLFLQNWIE